MLNSLDLERLEQALALARRAIGLSEPNPRVGCIVGHPDGRVIGRGHTQAVGGPHAEVMALRDAAAAGSESTRGATAWVTLEPCAHQGRTPPCTLALISAGVARVVVAIEDPFPSVAGRGIAQLRAAGIEVAVADRNSGPREAALVQAAEEINIGFFSRQRRGRPWVRVKLAASIDGLTALPDGRSQWITGTAARADGHAWRARAGAILTGIGTVLADDPRLDVRGHELAVQPLRVVLDRRGRTPASARLLQPPGRVWICTATGTPHRHVRTTDRNGDASVTIETHSLPEATEGNGLHLDALMKLLAAASINELHVEAGATLAGALHRGGWVDEWLLYLAPRLLGRGRPMLELPPATSLPAGPELRVHEVVQVGDDLRVRLRPHAGDVNQGVGIPDTAIPPNSGEVDASP
jgi:diaminohydroxyphosphoribosylaminopyrimidine deaminase / 5-amino-6-(5-phosphoribosylamino)uracil reductase